MCILLLFFDSRVYSASVPPNRPVYHSIGRYLAPWGDGVGVVVAVGDEYAKHVTSSTAAPRTPSTPHPQHGRTTHAQHATPPARPHPQHGRTTHGRTTHGRTTHAQHDRTARPHGQHATPPARPHGRNHARPSTAAPSTAQHPPVRPHHARPSTAAPSTPITPSAPCTASTPQHGQYARILKRDVWR
jgi:hypothetical protein